MRARVVVTLAAAALAAGALPPAAAWATSGARASGVVASGARAAAAPSRVDVAAARAGGTSVAAVIPDPRFRLLRLRTTTPRVDVTRRARKVVVRLKASHSRHQLVEGNVYVILQTADGAPDGRLYPSAAPPVVSRRGRTATFRAVITIPRYAEPTRFDVLVAYIGTQGRETQVLRRNLVEIVDRDPDRTDPRVASLRVTTHGGFPVDTRTKARRVHVRMHLVDDRSGPDWTRSAVILRAVAPADVKQPDYMYVDMRLVSGTRRDGVWAGTAVLGRGSWSGDWDTQVQMFDLVHDIGESYSGPLLRDYAPLPAGAGPFQVLGRGDRWRPQLVTAQVSPAHIAPTLAPVPVTVDVRLTDVGTGVHDVTAELVSEENGLDPVVRGAPASGTRRDGLWRFTFVLQPGFASAPTAYRLRLRVSDRHHVTWYRAPGYVPQAYDWRGEQVLTAAQTGPGAAALVVG